MKYAASISMVLQETAVETFPVVRDNFLTFGRFHGMTGANRLSVRTGLWSSSIFAGESDRKVQDLSGGFRRRVQVAKVFMVQTPLLFLDEFSTGMEPILKRKVMDSLREESKRGRTIVLTTQILSEAEDLCDDILILNKGTQIARGDLNTLEIALRARPRGGYQF